MHNKLKLLILLLITSLGVSTAARASIAEEVLGAAKAAVDAGFFIKDLILKARAETRQGKFFRTDKPIVALVKWQANPDTVKWGFLHLKAITSFDNDYLMIAQNDGDANRIRRQFEEWRRAPGEEEKPEESADAFMRNIRVLADRDRFKKDDELAALNWNAKFSQDQASITGGDLVTFQLTSPRSQNNIQYPYELKFTVDVSELDAKLKNIASGIKNQPAEFAADPSKFGMDSAWFKFDLGKPGSFPSAEVYFYIPDLLPKYATKT